MTRRRLTTLGVVCAALLTITTHARAGQDLFVDDDNGDGFQCVNAPYHTINDALAAAAPGDQIHVCPGVYAEQIVLRQNINLRGELFGSKRPVIKPSALATTLDSLDGANPIAAAILVDTDLVRISSIDVDLSAAGTAACTPMLAGIYYHNANGSIEDVHVSNAVLPLRPDCESGVGIFVESGQVGLDLGSPVFGRAHVVIRNAVIDGYQKVGLAAHGPRTMVVVKGGSATTTPAVVAGAAPTGYEIAFDAGGRVGDVTTSGNTTLTAGKMAAGLLTYHPGRTSYRRFTSTQNQVGAMLVGNNARIRRSMVTGSLSDGLIVLGSSNLIAATEIDGGSVSGCFINGSQNVLRGDFITDVPLGIWILNGSGNNYGSTTFGNVPFELRGVFGGLRDVTTATASPWFTRCTGTLSCDDGNACTTDICDPGTGTCSHAPLVCDDANTCTTDACDTVLGCQFTPVPDGTACTGGTCTGGVCL